MQQRSDAQKTGSAVDDRPLALFTDLYELTMLRAYLELGIDQTAVFSLFVRRLPPERNFLVAAGLDDLLRAIETLRFSDVDLAYLKAQGFPDAILGWLKDFRFSGDIHAMPEGTVFFENEAIVEVVAPMPEAQLIETLSINQIGFPSLIASKAARIVAAAQGRRVIDFGGRRAHGIDAAVTGARAAYIGGAEGTANVLAGRLYGVPVVGTMAHSFVQSFTNEMDAFRAFSRVYPETVLLVDTYDAIEGVRKVVALAREMGDAFRVRAIRIDSGDLLALSREARQILDEAGLSQVKIVASGGLDEYVITDLVGASAPIDTFGVGTDLAVSGDAPALDVVYKLTEFGGEGRVKLSVGKRSLPGRKQIFRRFENDVAVGDTIARCSETLPGTPLLQPVMRGGKRVSPPEPLSAIRDRAREEIARLPEDIRRMGKTSRSYSVVISPALDAFDRNVRQEITKSGGQENA
jgi:nicotinate phosphoribosyltransferase